MRYYVTERWEDGTLAVVGALAGDPVLDIDGMPDWPDWMDFLDPAAAPADYLASSMPGRGAYWTRDELEADTRGAAALVAWERGDDDAHDVHKLASMTESRKAGVEGDIRMYAERGDAEAAQLLRSGASWQEQAVWVMERTLRKHVA